MEAIRFRGALLRIIKKVLSADPRLGPFYLRNIDLADSYMRLWVRMEDVPSVAFLIPKKTLVTHNWWDSTSPSQWGTL